jgi:hypothetical protein
MKYLAGLFLLALLAPAVPAANDPDATETHTTCAKAALLGPALYCRMDLYEVRTGVLLDYVVYVPVPVPADAVPGMPPECATAALGDCLGGALCVAAPLADATLSRLCAGPSEASATATTWKYYQYKWSGASITWETLCGSAELSIADLSAYRLSFFSFTTWNDVPSSGDSTGCYVTSFQNTNYGGSYWVCDRNYICDWTGTWKDNIASSLRIR